MGAKNNDETVKYKLTAEIRVEGISSESDIVGALFGQTEGLLDSEMDFKQLQKSGRIGRIGLQINNKGGATVGTIIIPSSLNKIETAIIAATLESVDRVGPCECKITLGKIVDVRKEKRSQITKRASEIMKQWDLETREEVKHIPTTVEKDAKRGKIVTFGPDRLPAGPDIFQSPEIILVEGRADVINLLKMNIQNTIGIEGTKIPTTIKNLCKNRTVTALLDGDRGGDMILKELLLVASIDFIARAPFRKEVEDLGYQEVKNALKSKVTINEAKFLTEKLSVPEFLQNQGHRKSTWQKDHPSKHDHQSDDNRKRTQQKQRDPKPRKSYKQKRDDGDHQSSRYQKSRSDRDRPRSTSRPSDRSQRSSDQRQGFKRKIKDRFTRKRRGSQPQNIQVHNDLKAIINKTKQTFNAVFVNESHEPMATVSTDDAYSRLVSIEGIHSIIIDGVITQRMLDVAHQKSVQFIAGAMVGELTKRYEFPQLTTFNRISS
ncbi:MAG: DNA primase DnaG [Candidatus Kariarchaeaceae archaeon]|jgi:DNA primase